MKPSIPVFFLTSLITMTTATGFARHDVASTFDIPESSPPGNYCGTCILTGSGYVRELRTSEPANKCNTPNQGENYGSCSNQYCGLCVFFKDDNCQGDITYSGGAGAGAFNAKAARSYYCM